MCLEMACSRGKMRRKICGGVKPGQTVVTGEDFVTAPSLIRLVIMYDPATGTVMEKAVRYGTTFSLIECVEDGIMGAGTCYKLAINLL